MRGILIVSLTSSTSALCVTETAIPHVIGVSEVNDFVVTDVFGLVLHRASSDQADFWFAHSEDKLRVETRTFAKMITRTALGPTRWTICGQRKSPMPPKISHIATPMPLMTVGKISDAYCRLM